MVYSHLISNSVNDPLLPTAFITDSTLYFSLEWARDKDSIFCKIIKNNNNKYSAHTKRGNGHVHVLLRSFDLFARFYDFSIGFWNCGIFRFFILKDTFSLHLPQTYISSPDCSVNKFLMQHLWITCFHWLLFTVPRYDWNNVEIGVKHHAPHNYSLFDVTLCPGQVINLSDMKNLTGTSTADMLLWMSGHNYFLKSKMFNCCNMVD
jgi:hypothetical protein